MSASDSAASPVVVGEAGAAGPEDGVALCLSGGGYRAMLFHVGALWRLNEVGWLPKLSRISSVSGGSITAATLGLHWGAMGFDSTGVAANFQTELVARIRSLACETIEAGAVASGALLPRKSIADMVARAYRKHLFNDATLQQLPDTPRFVINATNLQTGVLWRFSKPYMADYTIGIIPNPIVELAVAVAASSAFPPFLSPMKLKLDPASFRVTDRGPNYRDPFNQMATLSDGGVYDNLGLQTAWGQYKTILVSDGGGHMQPDPKVHSDWLRQSIRVNSVIDNQVRSLRKVQIVNGFKRNERAGAYWGIRSHAADFDPSPGSLSCPPEQTRVLAATKTRLKAMDSLLQERLINWGYAICAIAMRRWVIPSAPLPQGFPYPGAAVGR